MPADHYFTFAVKERIGNSPHKKRLIDALASTSRISFFHQFRGGAASRYPFRKERKHIVFAEQIYRAAQAAYRIAPAIYRKRRGILDAPTQAVIGLRAKD